MKKLLFIGLFFTMGLLIMGCQSDQTSETSDITTEALREFTLDDLSSYTGENGTTAYIAVDGVVYDVTDEFDNGMHQDLQLGGTDATTVFSVSPHSEELLETLDVVGVLVDETTEESTTEIETTTEEQTTQSQTTQSQTTTEITTINLTTSLPIFTVEELATYDGSNGSLAYIAFNGIVYDVTDVYVNGVHQGQQLGGTDVTDVFETSPHNLTIFDSLTVVGYLEGYSPS